MNNPCGYWRGETSIGSGRVSACTLFIGLCISCVQVEDVVMIPTERRVGGKDVLLLCLKFFPYLLQIPSFPFITDTKVCR